MINKNFVEKFFLQVVKAKLAREEKKKEEKIKEEEKEEKKEEEKIERPLIVRFEKAKLLPSVLAPAAPAPVLPPHVPPSAPPAPARLMPLPRPPQPPRPPALLVHQKIDSLLANENITIIECSDGKIKARNSEIFETEVNEEETREIIKKFSELTRIPLAENILKATFMNFDITAIISDIMPSRFMIIRKKKEEIEAPRPT